MHFDNNNDNDNPMTVNNEHWGVPPLATSEGIHPYLPVLCEEGVCVLYLKKKIKRNYSPSNPIHLSRRQAERANGGGVISRC